MSLKLPIGHVSLATPQVAPRSKVKRLDAEAKWGHPACRIDVICEVRLDKSPRLPLQCSFSTQTCAALQTCSSSCAHDHCCSWLCMGCSCQGPWTRNGSLLISCCTCSPLSLAPVGPIMAHCRQRKKMQERVAAALASQEAWAKCSKACAAVQPDTHKGEHTPPGQGKQSNYGRGSCQIQDFSNRK